jgi:hypothetical protein
VLRGGTWSEDDPPTRCARRERRPPGERHPRIGLRLLAVVGYGGHGRGSSPVVFRTVDPDAPPDESERPGYRVRVVAVFDRLAARQASVPLPWAYLEGETSPLSTTMVPGRYYAQAERVVERDGRRGIERGPEMKFLLHAGRAEEVVLPIPRPGAILLEPQ